MPYWVGRKRRMTETSMVTPEYTISLADFKSVLKLLKIPTRSAGNGEILISHDGTRLRFVMQGMETSISGQGHWPGTARVAAKYFLPLIKIPPDNDPVTLRFTEGRLKIETYSIACRWQVNCPVPIDLPIDAPAIDILRLRFQHSLEDLDGAGLLTKLGQLEKDVRIKIKRAAVLLKTYGITEEDITRLYEEALRRRF